MLLAIGWLLAVFSLAAAGPKLLFTDDFRHGLSRWTVELEKPGRVEAKDGTLEMDVPAGCTVWFQSVLKGPVRIEYEATMVQHGGPYDRVSDLNAFWMATEAHQRRRSGKFEDYNDLRMYYVGQGGNGNTTTRFRRYIGHTELRPLLAESPVLLTPNAPHRIEITAAGNHIRYSDNGKVLFDFEDPAPYTRGRFAFRTTFSHIRIRHFRVYRLPK